MGHKLDITDKKFGKLTAIKEVSFKTRSCGRKKYYWEFKCDCGNICIRGKDKVTGGETKSCGCLYKEVYKSLTKDITGQKFNNFTAIEFDHKNNRGEHFWKFICDCGNIYVTQKYSVVYGGTKSCGCLKLKKASKAQLIKSSLKYKNWRLNVFKRDKFTCTYCDIKRGKLNAHHIENFASIYEDEDDTLLWDVSNGITFCESCHMKFHNKYGRKGNNKNQVLEFITK